jgi:hypothetical protein
VEQPRNLRGQFAPKSGGEVIPGSIKEREVWDAIRKKPGWGLIEGRVQVCDPAGRTRVLDGVAISPKGRYIGFEVKSGGGKRSPWQREFDFRLNSGEGKPVTGVGRHKGITIDRVILID